MITETTKYGKGYDSPQGLEENQYYELIYEFVDLAQVKGLTIRQTQKLFTDCADIILDVKLGQNSKEKTSDTNQIADEIDKLTRTISSSIFLR